ncbi:DNA polymerase III subunit delta', partial [Klebsiella oxytoca]
AVLSGQGDLAAAARFTAAALLCRGGDKPCGVCPDCRKVLRDVHPDVLTVTDPDHKNVSVEILRNVTADASVLPNEG